ncbi:MAG TPA: TldD/PmbA family protein [Vicinamibacteria bacterium]|nr:TldD/PmbA family protein [Vicinamibacteria bacterium]
MSTNQTDVREIARAAMKNALAKGAKESAATVNRSRNVSLEWRDGKIEKINEATTRGLSLQLYVDGRYSQVSSSDLRPEALDTFIADSITMTRVLAEDPFRALPEPALYDGRASVDLQLDDPAYPTVTPEQRRRAAQQMEEAARAVKGAEAILSVSTGFDDTRTESFRVASNGFEGTRIDTVFFVSAQVSVKDADGRRPEDSSFGGSRFLGEVPATAVVGREAAERAISRLGAKKPPSAVMTLVIDNRAAGRLMGALAGPLSGASLQQKRSFLEGKLGQAIGSPLLDVVDDPLIPKAFGSRLYDAEGLAAKKRPVFEKGVLRGYYIDTYYGKKLKMAPTSGGVSNLAWTLGAKPQAALIKDVGEGILVTGFLGGNSNGTTGDYSLGVQGFRIRGGLRAEPVGEMNIAGNMLDLMKRLTAVGDDPWPYSSMRTPTLVFEGVQLAGV